MSGMSGSNYIGKINIFYKMKPFRFSLDFTVNNIFSTL